MVRFPDDRRANENDCSLNEFPITDISREQFCPARENLLQKIKSRYLLVEAFAR